MVYLDKPYALVTWDEATRCVILEWRDFAYGEEYRCAHNKVLEVLEQRRSSKLLGDARKMRATSQDDQQWLVEHWIPRSAKAGLKHLAIVLPKSVIGQMVLQQLSKMSTGDKRLISTDGSSYFETVDEAKKWLKSMPD